MKKIDNGFEKNYNKNVKNNHEMLKTNKRGEYIARGQKNTS